MCRLTYRKYVAEQGMDIQNIIGKTYINLTGLLCITLLCTSLFCFLVKGVSSLANKHPVEQGLHLPESSETHKLLWVHS